MVPKNASDAEHALSIHAPDAEGFCQAGCNVAGVVWVWPCPVALKATQIRDAVKAARQHEAWRATR